MLVSCLEFLIVLTIVIWGDSLHLNVDFFHFLVLVLVLRVPNHVDICLFLVLNYIIHTGAFFYGVGCIFYMGVVPFTFWTVRFSSSGVISFSILHKPSVFTSVISKLIFILFKFRRRSKRSLDPIELHTIAKLFAFLWV